MKIPWSTPTVSSATAIGYTNLEQNILGLLRLAVITEDFANLNAWTETDSGSNVNLVGDGTVSLTGNNSYGTNGIRLTAGITLAEMCCEIQFKQATALSTVPVVIILSNGTALPNSYQGANWYGSFVYGTSSVIQPSFNNTIVEASVSAVIAANVYYKVKLYLLKNVSGEYRKFRLTIEGGIYTTETVLHEMPYTITAFANPMYFSVQSNTASANLVYIKELRIYSGYSAASPYIEWIADAGVGKTWQNFDRTAITFPAGFPTTNMTFSDSFDDGVEDYSVAAALATWQAVGKTTANKRYIRLRAYLVSDGATAISAPVCGPNSDTGTDIKDYSAAEEAARNKLNTGTTAADILTGKGVTLAGVSYDGTYEPGLPAPAAITISSVTALSNTSLRVNFAWAANAATIEIEQSANGTSGWANIATLSSGNYYNVTTGLSAATTYYFRARGVNATGNGSYGAVKSGATDNARSIAAYITRDMVTSLAAVTTANGYLTNVVACEQERVTEIISDRLPMVEVCGPAIQIQSAKHTRGSQYSLDYTIMYKEALNDQNTATDPATRQTENVGADLIKALMADHTRAGWAITTEPTELYSTLDEGPGGCPMFVVVLGVKVTTIVDVISPYQLG